MTVHPPRRPASASTADAIQDYIRDRRLAPGSPLPTEGELCEELGVSRSSVREAVRVLATLDIVEVRHGHGMFVGGLSLAPLVSGLVFRGSLHEDGGHRTLEEVVALREALDLMVAEELVDHYRGTDNADLRDLVRGMDELHREGESFREDDERFHTALLAPLGNRLVRQLGSALWTVHTDLVPLIGIAPAPDMDATVRAHDAIVDALEAGDAAAYAAAVHAHYAPLRRIIAAAAGQR